MLVRKILSLSLSIAVASAFSVLPQTHRSSRLTVETADSINAQSDNSLLDGETYSSSSVSRRDVMSQTLLGVTSSFLWTPLANAAEGGIGASPDSPIVVLGAGGKVGKLCTQLLSQQGLYVRATTRSGRTVLDNDDSPYVSYASADVSKLDSLEASLKGASGVIFAASASSKKKGGDPLSVDYLGLYNTAQACLDQKVPKLVAISAGTVTRPESLGFKATNFFVKFVYGDHIMDCKIAGENAMRDLYASSGSKGYAVIRPGGLNDNESVGAAKVHVSQGDVYSSEISRKDVALVTIATLLKGSATNGVTFEVNQEGGLGKAIKDLPDPPKELIHTGASSFDALLDGLLADDQIKTKFPDLVSDFKGEAVPPLKELLA